MSQRVVTFPVDFHWNMLVGFRMFFPNGFSFCEFCCAIVVCDIMYYLFGPDGMTWCGTLKAGGALDCRALVPPRDLERTHPSAAQHPAQVKTPRAFNVEIRIHNTLRAPLVVHFNVERKITPDAWKGPTSCLCDPLPPAKTSGDLERTHLTPVIHPAR